MTQHQPASGGPLIVLTKQEIAAQKDYGGDEGGYATGGFVLEIRTQYVVAP